MATAPCGAMLCRELHGDICKGVDSIVNVVRSARPSDIIHSIISSCCRLGCLGPTWRSYCLPLVICWTAVFLSRCQLLVISNRLHGLQFKRLICGRFLHRLESFSCRSKRWMCWKKCSGFAGFISVDSMFYNTIELYSAQFFF